MRFPFQSRHEQKHQGERAADERRYKELLVKAVERHDLDDFEGELLVKLAGKLGRNLEADADEQAKPLAYLIDADVREAANNAWDQLYREVMVQAHLPQTTSVEKLPFSAREKIEPFRVAHEARIRQMDELEAAMRATGRPVVEIRGTTLIGTASNLMDRYRFIRHERQPQAEFDRALARLTYYSTPLGGVRQN